jgi:NADPH:quinone reductase-like Zn-dependent oxidoreductase
MSELPEPVPRPREVLIRVMASTINIDDIHMAEGTFYGGIPMGPAPALERPVIPGSDVAGVVMAVGSKVRSVRPGDAVFGVQNPFQRGGAWAELCAVDERWVTGKPENRPFEEAAASGIAGLVALSALKAARLKPGARVVIVGASGGIGSLAVQMAARTGAEVVGICGSKSKERALQLGCSEVIPYDGPPWDDVLLGSGRSRCDAVLDLVGGEDVERAGRRVLGRQGRFVTVVGPVRFIGDRPLGWFGILTVVGRVAIRMLRSFFRGPRYILTGPGMGAGKVLPEVARALGEGMLPMIDEIVPFEEEAMRCALKRAVGHQNRGRIVIRLAEST